MTLSLAGDLWIPIRDGDRRALWLFSRHYSFHKRRTTGYANAERFAGPGEHLVLMDATCSALFVWRLEQWRKDKEPGINCAAFRNESTVRSSDLIRAADALAFTRWPGERHFTFVDPKKIRSTNPGCCFEKAGWTRLDRRSLGGLVILERWPT